MYIRGCQIGPIPFQSGLSFVNLICQLGWLLVGICKYNPGYKSHDLLKIPCSHWLKLQHSDWRANLVKDFLKINFPPMRALEFITGDL